MRQMRNEVTVQAIILSVLSVPLSACAEPDESVERSVAFIDREMHIIHAEGESDSARARDGCRILVNKVFDLDAMARGSLPEMWDSMEPDQHDIFRSAFAG